MEEKYKPFFRHDVKNWSMIESIFITLTLSIFKFCLCDVIIIIYGLYCEFVVNILRIDLDKPLPVLIKKFLH